CTLYVTPHPCASTFAVYCSLLPLYTLSASVPSPPPFFFFFNDPSTTEIYTLSLHDALPILLLSRSSKARTSRPWTSALRRCRMQDRKSTRLNSSHVSISYAVFCLKKKKKTPEISISKKKTKYTKQIGAINAQSTLGQKATER